MNARRIQQIGGVVAAVQQDAADAGAEVFRKGGNAADAAVATALAQGVVDPYRCGIGGGGMALVLDGKSGDTSLLSFYGHAPEAATSTMFKPVGHWGTLFSVEGQANQFGHLASVIPGMVRGLSDLFARWGSGTVSWQDVCEPAIRLARDGFLVFPFFSQAFIDESSDHAFLGVTKRTCTFTDAAAAVFAPDGNFPRLGQLFRQVDYAATLERIAQHGPDEFYEGETAARIAKDFAEHGGLIDAKGLRDYHSLDTKVIRTSYRGRDILSEDAPSVGPTFLQLMRLLETWDLAGMGFNSVAYVERFVGALNAVFQDRLRYIGDPDVVDVPLDELLSDERTKTHHDAIEAILSGRDAVQGPPPGSGVGSGSRDTTHTTVVDNDGNAVLITHSVGSGSGVVTPGTGFMHNNHMIQFDPRPGNPNSIAPRKRPNVGGAPALVFEKGALRIALGSPAGGRKASAMAQALVGMFDFGMGAQSATDAERFHAEDEAMSVDMDLAFQPRTATQLAARGYDVTFSSYNARIAAVERGPAGELTGIADWRGDRGVATVGRAGAEVDDGGA